MRGERERERERGDRNKSSWNNKLFSSSLLSSSDRSLDWGDWTDRDKNGRKSPFGAQYTLGVISCVKYLHSLSPSLLSLIKKSGDIPCCLFSLFLLSINHKTNPSQPCDLTPLPSNETFLLLHWTENTDRLTEPTWLYVRLCQMLTVIIWAGINIVNSRQFYI